MSELVLLDRQEEEHLIRVLEAGVNLADARHFYMWAQGALQGLIPHKVLVCLQMAQSQVIRLDSFHSPHLPKHMIEELTSSQGSSILQLLKACPASSKKPQWLEFEGFSTDLNLQRHTQRLLDVGLSNALVLGTPLFAGTYTQFMFLDVKPTLTPQRTAYLLELMLAQLHLAYWRCIVPQQGVNDQFEATAVPLSVRELDILRWVAVGKSNQEIAELLYISPFTVKNHVHNILKKLKVKNRMQAASMHHSLIAG
jgi:transcriptional regulator EpsA